MKEIGGYFELECFKNSPYHKKALSFNSARNALRYIIRAYNIKEILIPKYNCPVVYDAIKSEDCKTISYSIDENFNPKLDREQYNSQKTFIVYNNFFGICGNAMDKMAQQYPNLIADNAQAFYSNKKGIASFYSPRKFFGLPDGGLLLCDKRIRATFEQDISYDRCYHLLKRHDLSATEGYSDFQSNDNALENLPIKYMSELTHSLMSNINYEDAKKKRLENFYFLHENLKNINELRIDIAKEDVPLVYPLLIKNTNLRKKLIENKIYIAMYWPKISEYLDDNSFEWHLQKNLLPLPIDQRYGLNEMKFILDII